MRKYRNSHRTLTLARQSSTLPLASTAICVLGEKGKMVTEAQVASAPDALVSFLRELPHGIAAIGLEAGPLSNWLHKGLTDAGFEAVLMETRQVKAALKAMPIKTDRRDSLDTGEAAALLGLARRKLVRYGTKSGHLPITGFMAGSSIPAPIS